MIRLAPASLAPCTAFMPMPPTPTTTTVSPGARPARSTAEPQPVATPHDTRHDGVQREVVVDLDDRGLVHDGVLAEGAQLGEQCQLLATAVVADGAVGDLTLGEGAGARGRTGSGGRSSSSGSGRTTG